MLKKRLVKYGGSAFKVRSDDAAPTYFVDFIDLQQPMRTIVTIPGFKVKPDVVASKHFANCNSQ